jgi:AAA+ superfamily predicted ATPase
MDGSTALRGMVDQNYRHNARHLTAELQWFRLVVETRYKLFHSQPCNFVDISEIPIPSLNGHSSIYQQFLKKTEISWQERLILILAIAPHIQPYILDDFLLTIDPKFVAERFINRQSGFIPTVEAALFLLAGDDLEHRFLYEQIFDADALLMRENILSLDYESHNSSRLNARLVINQDFLSLFTSGKTFKPDYSHLFPAKRITTVHKWEDLVLEEQTANQIAEIKAWIEHGDTILYEWELIRKFAPGYKCLFYGSPGTGKTMTAALLGKLAGMDVYRVDLAMVVSKYIGETEKNLRLIFDTAHNKQWILFFDEAEALFGKRTEVKDAHDRFANQEVSYLLHRIEEHPGIVILATNKKNQLDDAFTRRFQTIVQFTMPSKYERLKIWQKGFSKKCVLERAIDLEQIAEKYQLAGGSIMNVIRYASLMALEAGSNVVMLKDLIAGIQREYTKEGKSL